MSSMTGKLMFTKAGDRDPAGLGRELYMVVGVVAANPGVISTEQKLFVMDAKSAYTNGINVTLYDNDEEAWRGVPEWCMSPDDPYRLRLGETPGTMLTMPIWRV